MVRETPRSGDTEDVVRTSDEEFAATITRRLPLAAALARGVRMCCPRCGRGRLYAGYLKVAKRCEECDLDYAKVDSGDGPAVFIILIVGFIVTFLALAVEVAFHPPYWVHAVLWTPLILVLSLGLLPVFKATLISLQYAHGAREARHDGHRRPDEGHGDDRA